MKYSMFWKRDKSKKKESLGSILLAVLVALTIRWALLEAYVIPSGSMLPSLLINDHIFVNKMIYGLRVPFTKNWLYKNREPKKGEVIVFKFPKDESIFYIKRVIGVPGDVVEHTSEGELFVNGQAVKSELAPKHKNLDWLRPKDFEYEPLDRFQHKLETNGEFTYSTLERKFSFHPEFSKETIPPGKLLVFGDNRDMSQDSRFFGYVPMENVLGKATFVWLSCEDTIWVLCNPLSIRWNRFFHSIH